MVYTHGEMVRQDIKGKHILPIVAALLLTAVISIGTFAHGGNPRSDFYVQPTDKNCMGQLARMHAQDDHFDGVELNGLPASFEMSTHNGFGLGRDKGDTVKDTMHAFKDHCKSDDTPRGMPAVHGVSGHEWSEIVRNVEGAPGQYVHGE